MRRGARLLAGALLALVVARPAGAGAPRTFALLVGCTTYPFLARALDAATYDARVRLRGPEADVAAFADVLTTTLGVPRAHVTTLVGWDDRAPLENPTRENVLRGLLRLARTVAPGDRVVFLFAGHGSRVPDGSGDEPDGLDEVLLPADVRTFEPEGRRVPGAILDDEVGQRLRAIRDAGATVWAVFDCCHAGTMARGGDGPTRARDLPGALLGVPAPATRGAPDASPGAADGDDLRGIAATYAVGPAARAVEMRLPRGAPDAPWRGLLSFALVEDLRRTRGAGDLAALDVRLAAAYDAAGFHGASPFTEGDRGLAPSGPGRVVPLPRDLPALAAPDARLRLARVDARGAALDDAGDGPRFDDPRFPWAPPASADWLLVHDAGRRFVLRPAATGARATAAVEVGPDGRDVVAALERIVRAENLVRCAAAAPLPPRPAGTPPGAASLDVRLEVPGPAGSRRLADRGTLRPGDRLRLDVTNDGGVALDVWVFLLDAAHGLSVVAPGDGESPRLRPGLAFRTVDAFVTDATLGVERVLAVAVPADLAAPPVDLRWLAAAPAQAAHARARAPGGGGGLGAWLAAYAFPDGAARGAPAGAAAPSFLSLAWTTAWGDVPAPTFPGPPDAGPWPPAAAAVDADPRTWLAGPRFVARAVATGDPARCDVVWSGATSVEVVGVDPRGTLGAFATSADGGARGGPRPPVLLRFLPDGARAAAYDRDLDGDPDLVLWDRDGDGIAERREVRRPAGVAPGWDGDDDVALPWLRAAWVAWPDDATAERAVRALRSLAP